MRIPFSSLACLALFCNAGALADYAHDPAWPGDLPNGWVLGSVSDVAIDGDNDVWVLHRPETVEQGEPAPAVLQFNQSGELLQAWELSGEDGLLTARDPRLNPHAIVIDDEGFVWIAMDLHHVVYKFTRGGQHVLTIGEFGVEGNDDSLDLLGGPADVAVDTAAAEVYVADGYRNHRVIVFDAETGAYKRRWGAYGQVPVAPTGNAEVSDTFLIAHGIARADDGRIYVADRGGTRYGARLQQFLGSGEYLLELDRPSMDVALSRDDDQRLLYIPGRTGDASEDQSVFVVDRATDESIDRFAVGPVGHQVAVDDGGNVYVAGLDLTGLSRYRKTN